MRLILAVGFVAGMLGAGYAWWTLDLREAGARAALAAADAQGERASRALADVGVAFEAYVAAGQQPDFWAPRAAAAIDSYRDAADALAAPNATDLVGADDVAQLDLRVRELVANGQVLVASDLLFTDGLDMLRTAAARIDESRHARRTAAAVTLTEIARLERYTAAAVLAATLVVIILLLPSGETPAAVGKDADEDGHFNVAPPGQTDQPDATLGAALDARLDHLGGSGDLAHSVPPIDLRAAADLCSDLGRLADASTLPLLLSRAAGLLGAKGLTIWMADPTGTLFPTAAHGYSPQALSRLGCVRREDDNAAATAFRTGSVQTVASDATATGALIVPLVGVGGCAGVMAAELQNGRERSDAVCALARIVAAQLSMLIPAAQASAGSEPAALAESG